MLHFSRLPLQLADACVSQADSTGRKGNSETHMHQLGTRINRFLRSDDGPTAVEYAIMLALVILVCLTAIRTFGSTTSTSLSQSARSIAS
jgi:pilus assembly protein Flp/PilA